MSTPKISLIIPVYNAAYYLHHCIKSILGQTYTEWEAIFINDGSTDDSHSILDEFAKKDIRIKIFHQENRGVSAARNTGLNSASGEFIAFCDADDHLSPHFMEDLYHKMIGRSADWVICNVNIIQKDDQLNRRLHFTDESIDISANRPAFLEKLMRFNYDYANWNKLYRAELIKKNNISFNEEMHIWEDLLFNLIYLQYAGIVEVIDKQLYHYRVHENSLFSGDTIHMIPQFNKLFNYYIEFVKQHNAYDEGKVFQNEVARIFYNQFLKDCEVHVKKEFKSPKSIYLNYLSLMRSFSSGILCFKKVKRNGWENIKKHLLTKGHLRVFSLVMTFKICCEILFKREKSMNAASS